jgi:nicotinamidase-related amidase/GrpB-like predicted nucleotidyltransferase (UPF0157 family)
MSVAKDALILIDMQKAIDEPVWAKDGERNNKNAEHAGMRLLESWRAAHRPIFHVKHDSTEPRSTYRPGQPGNDFKSGFEPHPGEDVVVKHTGSAFTATRLEGLLRKLGAPRLVMAGVITNNSVEASVRHGGTLGFEVLLVEDACFTFGRRDWNGILRSASEVHAMSLANIDGEYARVVTSAEVLAETGSTTPILPYFERDAAHHEWDESALTAAGYTASLITAAIPGVQVEHVGSTAAGCPGKGVLDLLILYRGGALDRTKRALSELGFQPQTGRDPFPEERPMRIGAVAHGGKIWRIHAHVIAAGEPEAEELIWFRDRLRADPGLREQYAEQKRSILKRGVRDTLEYCYAKGGFIEQLLRERRRAETPG